MEENKKENSTSNELAKSLEESITSPNLDWLANLSMEEVDILTDKLIANLNKQRKRDL